MVSRNVLAVAIAVVLGLVAVLIANAYFSGIERRQERIAAEQKLDRIVVATQPLAFGSRLTTDNVRLQNWPASSVPQGAFRSVAQALRDNRVALRPIVVGEPVLADKVSGKDGRASLAANLPQGMRAVSIPITNLAAGVSGFALPGMTVDILLTRQIAAEGASNLDQMVQVIMENVQVLAIDQLADEKTGKPKPGKTATVQTDIYGAQKLTLAQKIGTLSLALRNVENQVAEAGGPVTLRDFGARDVRLARMQAPLRRPGYVAPASRAATGFAPLPAGPTMAVYRGMERTEYSVASPGGGR
jgi:Flp pilus assembly protein CpaB